MSCYEHEEGEILLPTAAVAAVRRALNQAHNYYRQTMLDQSQVFWEHWARQTRSGPRYREALERWRQSTAPSSSSCQDLYCYLLDLADRPRRLRASDLCDYARPATNRRSIWSAGEAHIELRGRRISWHVPDNNHARQWARQHPLGRALFVALGRVEWTRGSGGYFSGNDEYNRDCRDLGAGGNYVTASFGPLGARAANRASSA